MRPLETKLKAISTHLTKVTAEQGGDADQADPYSMPSERTYIMVDRQLDPSTVWLGKDLSPLLF